jgi:RNase P subunit RPR2
MTLQFFCGNCGIRVEGNTIKFVGSKDYLLECKVCNFIMRFSIMPTELKTVEEVEAAFQQTELTDYQRTGRANKGKWARRKK